MTDDQTLNQEQAGTKRLFVALPVKGILAEETLAWQKAHEAWPIKWLKDESLHITVVSPWYETDIDAIVSKLESFAEEIKSGKLSLPAFGFNFNKVVLGPNRFSPRLVWAEGQAPVALLELKNRLEQALGKPDLRYYRLHLTLARFKAEDFGGVLPNLFDAVNWPTEVGSFALYESTLTADGAEYKKIKEFKFTA